jgi:hypothetical protein
MSRKQIKKNEGPTCACGRGGLYEEWLKQNKTEKDEISVSPSKVEGKADYMVNSKKTKNKN